MQSTIAAELTAHSASILVVDDDVDMREGLCEALLDEGYAVIAATDGSDAVRKLSDTAPPDLILMDLRMPIMDGYEFLQRRHDDRSLSGIPVIVLSASLGKAIQFKGVQVLHKPVDLESLLGVIRRELGGRVPPAA